jgi:hypothetical protein
MLPLAEDALCLEMEGPKAVIDKTAHRREHFVLSAELPSKRIVLSDMPHDV